MVSTHRNALWHDFFFAFVVAEIRPFCYAQQLDGYENIPYKRNANIFQIPSNYFLINF